MDIMKIFADTAYVRMGGSAEELRAAEYLKEQCAAMGLEATIEGFPVQMANIEEATLVVDGKEITCKGYRNAGSHEVEAPLYYLSSTDPYALSKCKGKIVLIDGYLGYWMYRDILENGAVGFKNITMCDRQGALYVGCPGMNWAQAEMAARTNPDQTPGTLAEKLVGADVFIGTSAPGIVTREMVATMNKDAIVFACANPTPEIFPDEAKAGGALIVSTGRSDFPNQINNVLAFPGIFRGAFDVRASAINEEMKLAAAYAIAAMVPREELGPENIIPKAFDRRVGPAVAKAVAEAARKTGVARI